MILNTQCSHRRANNSLTKTIDLVVFSGVPTPQHQTNSLRYCAWEVTPWASVYPLINGNVMDYECVFISYPFSIWKLSNCLALFHHRCLLVGCVCVMFPLLLEPCALHLLLNPGRLLTKEPFFSLDFMSCLLNVLESQYLLGCISESHVRCMVSLK